MCKCTYRAVFVDFCVGVCLFIYIAYQHCKQQKLYTANLNADQRTKFFSELTSNLILRNRKLKNSAFNKVFYHSPRDYKHMFAKALIHEALKS